MWNKLPLIDHYSILFDMDEKKLELHLTDFISIWYKGFSIPEFATCLKESNRLLEIDEAVLMSKAVDMLKNVHSLTKVQASKERNNSFALDITRMEGFPIRLRVSLDEESKDMFFHRVTLPLLQTVNDLRSSEKKLSQLLLRKDKEIKEYKEEGGKIALRHLKTPQFDEETHLKTHSCYSRYFGGTDMDIICRVEKIKEESPPIVTKDELRNATTSTSVNNTTAAVKLESISNLSIKQESTSNLSIKQESTSNLSIKQESTSNLSIKQEPSSQSSCVSPRKRKKVLNL